jgi:predicted RNA binding protein YcfA (HicA-like mRNA interferase family)
LEARGFAEIRHEATSHRRWRGVIDGEVKLVTVAYHNIGAHIGLTVLQSMIRQSGLSKKLFCK